MEPRLKWNKIILAAQIISFQTSCLKWNKIVLAAKTILFQKPLKKRFDFVEHYATTVFENKNFEKKNSKFHLCISV